MDGIRFEMKMICTRCNVQVELLNPPDGRDLECPSCFTIWEQDRKEPWKHNIYRKCRRCGNYAPCECPLEVD